jgi:hypothetical protein
MTIVAMARRSMRIMFRSLEYLGRSLASTARAGIGADYGLLVGGLPSAQ